jgi:hypothetical protein
VRDADVFEVSEALLRSNSWKLVIQGDRQYLFSLQVTDSGGRVELRTQADQKTVSSMMTKPSEKQAQSVPVTDWVGTYVYSANYGTTSDGIPIIWNYEVVIRRIDSSHVGMIRINGYQVDDKFLCDVKELGETATLLFKAHDNGEGVNQYGVGLFDEGQPLLSLERQSTNGGDRLLTRWLGIRDARGQIPPPGEYFRKTGNNSLRSP